VNILIIDDNKNYIRVLKTKVLEMCRKNTITANITTTDKSEEVLKTNLYLHYDVILLDIDMPEITGIQLASQINASKGRSEKPYIVFVSCKDGLVFDALKELPYSFVRKEYEDDLEAILISIYEKINMKDTYTILNGRHIDTLIIEDIIYLEKKKNYVVFHTVSGEYRERTKIEEKYHDLADFGFLRPQIGYLVNIKYINDILLSSIVLDDGTQLPLSKKYRKTVKDYYFDWMVSRK
jgi:DNA-binding LytR/AlgR family response regulator